MVVCPDINSPAQSLASVIKVPSNSCLPCRLAFCSFCFGSFGASSGSLRQHRKANARHSNTMNKPARNVNMLESRKHHHFLPRRQSSSGVRSPTVDDSKSIDGSVVSDIPCTICRIHVAAVTIFGIHFLLFIRWVRRIDNANNTRKHTIHRHIK